MAVDRRAVREDDHFTARHAANHHMAIAGTNKNAPSNKKIAGLGFLHIHRAAFIQTAGEHFGKTLWHVLNNDKGRREIRGNLRQQILQGVRATRGNSNSDYAIWLNGGAATLLVGQGHIQPCAGNLPGLRRRVWLL